MKISKHFDFVRGMAAIIIACSGVASFAWAAGRAKPAPRPFAVTAAMGIESPNKVVGASSVQIEQIRANPSAGKFPRFYLAPKALLGNAEYFQDQESSADKSNDKSDPNSADQEYVIGTQDLLAINVWHEPELSRSVPVRPDGKISMPLVGELEVRGLTPHLVQLRLTKELEAYIRKPQVTVIVQEANSHKFFVMGEVQRPGAYPLTTSMTVLDALATAGGFKDFAKVNKILVLRAAPDGSRERIPFQYKQAIKGGKSTIPLQLMPGDTVIVP